ncbi:MAG: hypothetical protein K1X94_13970 [Sandaracinaceae bacterium]|nr:hypothetical protein [Sandaracinaceae bacterium]
MSSMPRRLALFVLAAFTVLPARAAAQSVFAFEMPLTPERAIVGQLNDAPLTIVRWLGPSEALVRFQDRELRIEVPLALDRPATPGEPRTHVVVGVGRRAPVTVGPWRVTMEAGAWAPLRGHEGESLRVALPPGLPSADGLVSWPRGRGPSGAPHRAFEHAEPSHRGFELACRGQLELRAATDPSAPRWPVPVGASYRVRGAASPFDVEVRVEGFVVHGFVDARPAPCESTLGLNGFGSGCGDGISHGLVVRVPAGTPLYASDGSSEPFAWTRRAVIAREDLDAPRMQTCTSIANGPTTCAPSPPLPTGPQRLLFDREDERGPDWSFLAHVRIPIESLPVVQGHGGFGGCHAPPSDWPPP